MRGSHTRADSRRMGSFNLHPGPLPRYAGLNVRSWAIYQDEQTHGVTLHWMEARVDTGPIAFETMFDLSADDSGLSREIAVAKASLTGGRASRVPGTAGETSGRNIRVVTIDGWILVDRVGVDGAYFDAADVLEPDGRFVDETRAA